MLAASAKVLIPCSALNVRCTPLQLMSHQAKFLTHYVHTGILPRDPFETIDEDGVGEMVSCHGEGSGDGEY